MKQMFFILITFLGLNPVHSQDFDMVDFNKKTHIAQWLLEYDLKAWYSTDTLKTKDSKRLSKLGREWFCFQDSDSIWHAVYGKYENGKYDQIFHFIVKSQTEVFESEEQIDTTFLNKYGKALSRAFLEMKPIGDSTSLLFNHYIKENEKGNFDIYIFPAYQPDGTAVFGGEFIYEISPKNKIIKNDSYLKEFLGVNTKEQGEVWLDYTEIKKPTLGSVFFVWYYKYNFSQIYIDNQTSFTTLIDGSENFHWATIIKDPKEESKIKKEQRREKRKERKQK